MLSTVRFHLKIGVVFIFDFWYGPGVLSSPPVERVKEIKKGDIQIKRIARPEMKPNENIVDINYILQTTNGLGNKNNEIMEIHTMRYFFKPELDLLLSQSGFELIKQEAWMENAAASLNTWNAMIIARVVK